MTKLPSIQCDMSSWTIAQSPVSVTPESTTCTLEKSLRRDERRLNLPSYCPENRCLMCRRRFQLEIQTAQSRIPITSPRGEESVLFSVDYCSQTTIGDSWLFVQGSFLIPPAAETVRLPLQWTAADCLFVHFCIRRLCNNPKLSSLWCLFCNPKLKPCN